MCFSLLHSFRYFAHLFDVFSCRDKKTKKCMTRCKPLPGSVNIYIYFFATLTFICDADTLGATLSDHIPSTLVSTCMDTRAAFLWWCERTGHVATKEENRQEHGALPNTHTLKHNDYFTTLETKRVKKKDAQH